MKIFQLLAAALLLLGLNTGGATAATAGRVEGQLVNGTADGSRVDNQEIILQVYDAQQQVGEQTTKTDAAGKFGFDGLSTGAGFYYRAVVTYQEVSYQSQVGQIITRAPRLNGAGRWPIRRLSLTSYCRSPIL